MTSPRSLRWRSTIHLPSKPRRDQLSNRVNADPEAGLVFRKHDEQMDSEINGLREKISMLKRVRSNPTPREGGCTRVPHARSQRIGVDSRPR